MEWLLKNGLHCYFSKSLLFPHNEKHLLLSHLPYHSALTAQSASLSSLRACPQQCRLRPQIHKLPFHSHPPITFGGLRSPRGIQTAIQFSRILNSNHLCHHKHCQDCALYLTTTFSTTKILIYPFLMLQLFAFTPQIQGIIFHTLKWSSQ